MPIQKQLPATIENRWDILYRDYPENYDRWAKIPKTPTAVEFIQQHFPMAGKTVADIGSGSGLSTFELARYAGRVIGIEPELSMRNIAEQQAERQGLSNVQFHAGFAENIPLPDHCVDAVVAITLASLYNEHNIAAFIHEAERIARPGGVVLSLDSASGWYGGELAEVILGRPRSEMETTPSDHFFPAFGYRRLEFFTRQDYGSVENTVQTYGFIFGQNAIRFIRTHQVSVIHWKFNIHYRWIEPPSGNP